MQDTRRGSRDCVTRAVPITPFAVLMPDADSKSNLTPGWLEVYAAIAPYKLFWGPREKDSKSRAHRIIAEGPQALDAPSLL